MGFYSDFFLLYTGDTSDDNDLECAAMQCIIKDCKYMKIEWVACDNCNDWFHLFCVGFKQAPDNFKCNF